MNLAEKTELIQRKVGVAPDGVYGNDTADAIIEKLGVSIPAEPPVFTGPIKLCIDPGHGQDSRNSGVYDSGATDGHGLEEADIVMGLARLLQEACIDYGIPTWLTRDSKPDSAPLGQRVARAKTNGCTHLISLHINDADVIGAHGYETLYRDDKDFADRLHSIVLGNLGLSDRGVKQRTDLAILKFDGKSALLEFGFIKNIGDMDLVRNEKRMSEVFRAIAKYLSSL